MRTPYLIEMPSCSVSLVVLPVASASKHALNNKLELPLSTQEPASLGLRGDLNLIERGKWLCRSLAHRFIPVLVLGF